MEILSNFQQNSLKLCNETGIRIPLIPFIQTKSIEIILHLILRLNGSNQALVCHIKLYQFLFNCQPYRNLISRLPFRP